MPAEENQTVSAFKKFKCDSKLVLAPLGSCIAYTMTETPKRDFHKAISRLSDTLHSLKLLPPTKTQNW